MKHRSIIILAAVVFLCCGMTAVAQTLISNKTDYRPGEMAILTGTGFGMNEVVTMQVLHADGTPSTGEEHQPWTVTADTNGAFITTWHVCEDDCLGSTLRATAVGTSGMAASALFTDGRMCTGTCSTTINKIDVQEVTTVDGDPSDWNLANNFFSEMWIAGDPTKQNVATAYLRYNCTGQTAYVLVLGKDLAHYPIDTTGSNAWAALDGGPTKVYTNASGSNGIPPDFRWIVVNNVVIGYEASFDAAGITSSTTPGTSHCIVIHVEVTDGVGGSQATGGTPSFSGEASPCLLFVCTGQTGCTPVTKPTINCPSGANLGCNPTSIPTNDPGVTASDNCGSVTVTSSFSDAANGCQHNRTITYTATNSIGTSTCVQTLTWTEDIQGPVITASGSALALGCNPTAAQIEAALGSATASDNCGPVTPTSTTGNVVVQGCSQSQTRTWNAADACGNAATSVSRTATWTVDTTPPVITCPSDTIVNGGGECSVAITLRTATATDNCSGAVTITNNVPAKFSLGTTTVTWTATDACGNQVTCTQKVTVLGQICVKKFFDANANGLDDDGMVVSSFKIKLSNGDSSYTKADGNVCFNVLPGNYTVTEIPPGTNWQATKPRSVNVTIDATHCSASVTFGNYCFDPPSKGLTLGFWSNKNGQTVLQAHDPAWRTLLNGLSLRNLNGTVYQVSTSASFSTAYTSFKNWLLNANATNMAYMLSAQLAANALNVAYNGLSSAQGIIVPGGVKTPANVCIVPFLSATQPITCGSPAILSLTAVPGSTACECTSNNGLVTVGALQARAVCLLGTYGNTVSASTQRTYEECVKDILDMINNNGNNGYACGGVSQYINPGPSSCPLDPNYGASVNPDPQQPMAKVSAPAPITYGTLNNYPNPFNPTTIITYAIPENVHVSLKVYDILGQEVANLVDEAQSVGRYNVTFNASKLSSGLYFYRLQAGNSVTTRKLLLTK